jgi:hypothetical protein
MAARSGTAASGFRKTMYHHSKGSLSQQMSPRFMAQSSQNGRFLPNNTLLQHILHNKGGKQVRMPLASTFNRKNQMNLLSKDQLLMI